MLVRDLLLAPILLQIPRLQGVTFFVCSRDPLDHMELAQGCASHRARDDQSTNPLVRRVPPKSIPHPLSGPMLAAWRFHPSIPRTIFSR
jgi:hypothetical protein